MKTTNEENAYEFKIEVWMNSNTFLYLYDDFSFFNSFGFFEIQTIKTTLAKQKTPLRH
jgi:hypothetical protein